jgi:hypothetical protein
MSFNRRSNHDDYMTSKIAWENIQKYIPKDKVIWECFYGDGNSGKYLRELGFNVIHEDKDFFKWTPKEYALSVSNPPFFNRKIYLEKLRERGKPFIMIMPINTLGTQYLKKLFKNEIQVIIPPKRLSFDKLVDGKIIDAPYPNFDCLYYCWKMNLPRDIVFLP